MANSWLMSPETGHETFLKAQLAVLADSAFNTAVFRTPVACTKQELGAAIFETGESLIFWQDDLFLSYFSPNKFYSLSCFLFKILTKNSTST